MNLKTSLYFIVVLLVAAGVILVSRQFSPGTRTSTDIANALPDHIVKVVATTLPQAVLQSRQRGKGGVRITDPSGNTIWVSTDDVLSTKFVVRGTPMNEKTLQKGIEGIFDAASSTFPRMRDATVQVEEPISEVTFVMNETNHAKISDIMYEISVDIFKIRSTSDWVIDLTSEPY